MRTTRALVLFVLLLAFWQVLSGRLDPLFITLGLLSAGAVTVLSVRLLEGVLGAAADHPKVRPLQLLGYLLWLIGRLPPAGLHVARVVLDPRIPPRPGVVRFRTTLASPAARTLLANSITLVPGTMTLAVEGDEFTVHAFTPGALDDLANAATQRRIAAAFGQPGEDPPALTWEPAREASAPEELR
jgi:multicomponent Na+:H+ antiporter subunit E